jgi:hypothetical protein
MLGRYFFIILGIVSIGWIGYIATDIIDKGNDYSPSSVFGKEDGKILIITRKNEVDRALLPFGTTLKNEEILGAIFSLVKENSTIFISSLRDHFLIESKGNWNKNKIRKLLSQSRLTPYSSGIASFEFGGYHVSYHKNYLYFYRKTMTTTRFSDWKSYDRKASASLIEFNEGKTVVKDIYFKDQNKIEFHTTNVHDIKGYKINDKELFAQVIPKRCTNYHFIEKKFAESSDIAFQNGPMSQWIDKGFVSFKFKGKEVIISDYKPGQNPVSVLTDLTQKQPENEEHGFFRNIRLTHDFPEKPSEGFHIYLLNDFVIISEASEVCEEIITENKLGNTLATDQLALGRIFYNLPSHVSERVINENEQYTKTVYHSKIFETRLSYKQTDGIQPDVSSEIETLTMNVDAVIQDFISFDEKGNAAVLTATGELIYFSNGKVSWIKNLQSKGVGSLFYLESFQYLLVTCKNSIHLLDRKGNYVVGAPIAVGSNKPIQPAVTCDWRHKLYFVYPDENGNIVVVNSKRKIQSTIKHGLTGVFGPIDCWQSRGSLFFGVRNNTTFKMIDFEKRSEYRSFNIPYQNQSISKKNELLIFGNDQSQFCYFDQKGNKHPLGSILGNIMRTPWGRNETFLTNENNGILSVYDAYGVLIGKVTCDGIDLEASDVQTIQNKTFITLIDGLENNVYVYDSFGRAILNSPLEGSKKCMLNWSNGHLVLTAIVDKYLIQYKLTKN